MDIVDYYHFWLKLQKGIGLLLAVLIFGGIRYLLLIIGFDPQIVKSIGVAMMLLSCAVAMLLLYPIEYLLFAGKIEHVPFSKTAKIAFAVLFGIGIVLLIFETKSSMQANIPDPSKETEDKAFRQQLRDAQKTNQDAIKRLNEIKASRQNANPASQP